MIYTLNPRGRTFNVEEQFPQIDDDKYAVVCFSGGMESSLIASFAADAYGIDRVKFVVLNNIFNRDEPLQIEIVHHNTEMVMEYLGASWDNLHHFDFDSELHKTDRLASLMNLSDTLQEEFHSNTYFGFTNVFFDVEPLNTTAVFSVEDMRSVIESDRERFERVIDEFHTDYTDKYLELLGHMGITTSSYEVLRGNENIYMPFQNLDKGEIVDLYYQAGKQDLLYNTWSCTMMDVISREQHCGQCFNCQQRYDGHVHTNREDLTQYTYDDVKQIWNLRD